MRAPSSNLLRDEMYNVTMNVQFDGFLPKPDWRHCFRAWRGGEMFTIVSLNATAPAGYDEVQYLGEIDAALTSSTS